MRLYEATPDGDEERGAVVVIQEAFGVNPHIEDVTRRFAAVGYHGQMAAKERRENQERWMTEEVRVLVGTIGIGAIGTACIRA